jgi:NADPH-dependent curcumin reductase CurA
MPDRNRQILLKGRPKGPVTRDTFEIKDGLVPDIQDGQFLVKTLYLSIDPTIRGWIDRDTYLPAIEIGAVVRSAGAGVVVKSSNPKFAVGDHVFSLLGWQEYAVLGDKDNPNPIPSGIDLRDALSLFGATGVTAYFGVTEIGKPVAGETFVVSGAAGATGSIAGQLAKAKGCRVVGIAGQDSKCRWLTEELGFDAAINYKTEDVPARLAETCPKGIDVYFDNVGGQILNHVLARLAMRGRVILCGAISQYNDLDNAFGPSNYVNLIARRGRMEGFIVLDYIPRYMEAVMALGGLHAEGKLKHKVTVVDGLDNAPIALQRLFTGDHEGKLLVKVATE